jgi:translocation and assembly module TamA
MSRSGLPRLCQALALAGILLMQGGCSTLAGWWPGAADKAADAEAAAGEAGAINNPNNARLVAEYDLVVQAPTVLRNLLQEHLDLARFRNAPADQRLSPQELLRLSAAAPQQALALLETEGYFNAQVEVLRSTDQPLTLTVTVVPGELTRVKQVSLDFNGSLQTPAAASAPTAEPTADQLPPSAERVAAAAQLRQQLQNDWSLSTGAPFTQGRWSSAKTALLGKARAQGYPLARWDATAAVVNTEANSADIALALNSGPLFVLGELRVEGLKYQPHSSIERLAGYSLGDPYSERRLLDFQERLLKTTLFEGISVEIDPELGLPATATSTATATAAPASESASAPTGASTSEPGSPPSSLPGSTQVSPVIVKLREAARQQVTLNIGFNAEDGPRIGADYINRRPFDQNLRARTKLDLSRNKSALDMELSSHPQEDMQRWLGAVYLERLQDNGKVQLNLRTRLGRARENDGQDRIVYAEVLRAHETAPQNSIDAGAVSANVQWTRRRVNSTLLPTDGFTASLLLGAGRADSSVASSGLFGSARVKLHGYKPLPGQWFGIARAEVAQIVAADTVGLPEKLRFRAGGDESVRGYGFENLGPVDIYGNPTGGKVMASASLELAHNILLSMPELLGAAFFDLGQAAPSWAEFKPYYGYGLGLRYRSPLGTLRLDFARAHQPQTWRLHFSVGIAL